MIYQDEIDEFWDMLPQRAVIRNGIMYVQSVYVTRSLAEAGLVEWEPAGTRAALGIRGPPHAYLHRVQRVK